MIKFDGPKYPQGSGDYNLFGYLGEGTGRKIRFQFFSYLNGNGSGKGYFFGNRLGDGESGDPHSLKEEFQK